MVTLVYFTAISLYALIHVALLCWRNDARSQDAHIEQLIALIENREARFRTDHSSTTDNPAPEIARP